MSIKSVKSIRTIRLEDRHSCHNISFVLALATAAGDADIAHQAWSVMKQLVSPVHGQAAN